MQSNLTNYSTKPMRTIIVLFSLLAAPCFAQQFTDGYYFDSKALNTPQYALDCDNAFTVLYPPDSGTAKIMYDFRKPRTVEEIDEISFHVVGTAGAEFEYVVAAVNWRTTDVIATVKFNQEIDTVISFPFTTDYMGRDCQWVGIQQSQSSTSNILLDCASYHWRVKSSVDDKATEITHSVDWYNELGIKVFHGTEKDLIRLAPAGFYFHGNRHIGKID